ncbi:MAG: hypothetical protein JWM55_2179 [Acidimicrobiaceae bacterium]|nr:hypothetical protein [Acidimicrobiaceae bacterium]
MTTSRHADVRVPEIDGSSKNVSPRRVVENAGFGHENSTLWDSF